MGRDAARAAARTPAAPRAPVSPFRPSSLPQGPDWVARGLTVAAALCLLLLLVGLVRVL
jgi:hypothetical protein